VAVRIGAFGAVFVSEDHNKGLASIERVSDRVGDVEMGHCYMLSSRRFELEFRHSFGIVWTFIRLCERLSFNVARLEPYKYSPL